MPKIARVIVEVARNREFDYLIPERLQGQLQVGMQVVVPFGHSEARGYIVGFAEEARHPKLKEILDPAGQAVLVDKHLLELARWIGDYYLAPVERAIHTVLPGAVRRKGTGFKERLMVQPGEAALDELAVEKLRRKAPKQAAVLDALRSGGSAFLNDLARAAGTNSSTIRALEKKGWVHIGRHTVDRDPLAGHTLLRTEPLVLMPQQKEALDLVCRAMDTLDPPVVLLYGVTGSGKTEVYLQAIQRVLDRGQGAIVLVPEISLTPQTIERFHGRFGNTIAVLHSHLGEGERHDEWHRVRQGRARVVIGARSALFAPVDKLGLIVVDEEHEPTYKQEETPAYHARDVAVMRGRFERCAVLLGSATPSLESFHNTRVGKYGLARMPIRADHRTMPAVRVVDMRVEAEREGRPNVFSRDLVEAIRGRLDRAEQTMLFLNRRGYATSLVCPKCGYVARCSECSVAMTYHRHPDAPEELLCHVCGARRAVPTRCPNDECRDPAFKFAGFGTQRIEQIVTRLFPKARVQRMDSDTTSRKDSHRRILGEFRTGRIDILVGTQMIAKGLHFPNVTLVGVLYADLSLHQPDFRAAERTFQLLTQVAGRAGRGQATGEVLVQTYTPFHPSIQAARRLDYDAFFDQEVEFRKELDYPPFGHLICLHLQGPGEEKVSFAGQAFVRALQPKLPATVRIAGPIPAPLARARGQYRYQIILRAPATRRMTAPLKEVLDGFKWPEDVRCIVDVDAVSLL
ncbi:MAG: primosomal protein N' [Verrucomicrobia bacterium]|nr:primosomal protein N' [Verrucomicrobiota bacterium]